MTDNNRMIYKMICTLALLVVEDNRCRLENNLRFSLADGNNDVSMICHVADFLEILCRRILNRKILRRWIQDFPWPFSRYIYNSPVRQSKIGSGQRGWGRPRRRRWRRWILCPCSRPHRFGDLKRTWHFCRVLSWFRILELTLNRPKEGLFGGLSLKNSEWFQMIWKDFEWII